MNENTDTTGSGKDQAELELEMQELEALEAPGFWTGVSIGATVSTAVVTSVAIT
ncbi:daptide-type RiPP [Actinoplanes sp. N902-109]|uniref:daptide-type RiPP n=1 Tax=Actinoplanes sp. (strain N902-109) TaxID=649831 RepID=UPI00032939ED|nr:daptide-type RiPP [Actinoplanes sp. N902-109]AGL13762.1 hypothetical protein L083_0252 [Actinoplanes sp. N902-109]